MEEKSRRTELLAVAGVAAAVATVVLLILVTLLLVDTTAEVTAQLPGASTSVANVSWDAAQDASSLRASADGVATLGADSAGA